MKVEVKKKETLDIQCSICSADLGAAFAVFMDDSATTADPPAPTLDLLKTTKLDIIRLDGIEREIVLCPRCSTFLEKKLKRAWSKLTDLIRTEEAAIEIEPDEENGTL